MRHTIMELEAANRPVVWVAPESMITEATSKMILNDFSQLPVMSSETKIEGVISWRTIGVAGCFPVKRTIVKDCMDRNVKVIKITSGLLNSVRDVLEKDFVFVKDADDKITGIVTLYDIAAQFRLLSEPFLELQQIEGSLRKLIERSIDNSNFILLCKSKYPRRKIDSTVDLTFGEYLRIIEDDEFWNNLEVALDRNIFVDKLNEVRIIRNEVMHFKSDGISHEKLTQLKDVSKFFRILERMT